MYLNINIQPTLYRWFGSEMLDNPVTRYAITDLLQFVSESAVGTESELDVIGPSSYLIGMGMPKETVDKFVQVAGQEIRLFYMNNTQPEWRSWGRHRITIDAAYNIFIQLGIDPYV